MPLGPSVRNGWKAARGTTMKAPAIEYESVWCEDSTEASAIAHTAAFGFCLPLDALRNTKRPLPRPCNERPRGQHTPNTWIASLVGLAVWQDTARLASSRPSIDSISRCPLAIRASVHIVFRPISPRNCANVPAPRASVRRRATAEPRSYLARRAPLDGPCAMACTASDMAGMHGTGQTIICASMPVSPRSGGDSMHRP